MNIYGKLAGKAELTKQASTQNENPQSTEPNASINLDTEEENHTQSQSQSQSSAEKPKEEPRTPTITTSEAKTMDNQTISSSNSMSTETPQENYQGTEEKKMPPSTAPPQMGKTTALLEKLRDSYSLCCHTERTNDS